MAFSKLVTASVPAAAGNYLKGRPNGKVTHVTVHHMAGSLTVEACGRVFQAAGRKASTNYGVNGDKVGGYVDEADTPYSDANYQSNTTTVSIEFANDGAAATNWHVSDATVATGIKLIADIFKRNGLGAAVVGKTLCYHSMYCATACPGPYLRGKLQEIADGVNALLKQESQPEVPIEPAPASPSARQVGDVVEFTAIYLSSTATAAKKPAYTKGRITRIIASARNPYLVEKWGWVNEAGIVGGSASASAPETPAASATVYVVKKGDTLGAIAKAHGTTAAKLAAANGIKNPNVIYIGQKIKIG